jgi:hypothetical protein
VAHPCPTRHPFVPEDATRRAGDLDATVQLCSAVTYPPRATGAGRTCAAARCCVHPQVQRSPSQLQGRPGPAARRRVHRWPTCRDGAVDAVRTEALGADASLADLAGGRRTDARADARPEGRRPDLPHRRRERRSVAGLIEHYLAISEQSRRTSRCGDRGGIPCAACPARATRTRSPGRGCNGADGRGCVLWAVSRHACVRCSPRRPGVRATRRLCPLLMLAPSAWRTRCASPEPGGGVDSGRAGDVEVTHPASPHTSPRRGLRGVRAHTRRGIRMAIPRRHCQRPSLTHRYISLSTSARPWRA